MKRVWIILLLWVPLPGPAQAEQPVHFSDRALKTAVEEELWVTDPTPADMLGLTSLDATSRNIGSLIGLEYATNLRALRLRGNQISDVSPLSGLAALQTLVLNNNQISDISPLSGLSRLEYLDVHENRLSSVASLAGLTSLRYLNIHDNQLPDISPLSRLSHLETAVLGFNGIRDISVLAGLTVLTTLYLEYNRIQDISALSSLGHLQDLNLYDNQVTDLSPLMSLTSLVSLDLRANPWSEGTCEVDVPRLVARNPGVHILHDCGPFAVSISSTAGGSVVDPGEGQFTCQYGEAMRLEAKADPCFVFVAWSGSYSGSSNPATIVVHENRDIQANFISTLDTIHVDDNAPGDPGPDDPRVSDPQENGTRAHPFDRIREAIDVATDGATIVVHGGTYRESINFQGKRIELTGFDRKDANAAGWPTIVGDPGPAVSFSRGEGSGSILAGIVITAGTGRLAGAIRCSASSPTITHCLIAGNHATDFDGVAVYCTDSNALLINCTIADNQAGQYGAALSQANGRVTVVNSILWNNTPKEILFDGEYTPSIRYTTVAGGWPGQGNLRSDPLFARVGRWTDRDNPNVTLGSDNPNAVWVLGDYHLQSRTGRWDPETGQWVRDPLTSPCIDAGAPDATPGCEPSPNGGIINLGVYGGTPEASMSASNGSSP